MSESNDSSYQTRPGVSIVVPVFRSLESLSPLVRRLHQVLSQVEHEIILVDDGSPIETWNTVRLIADTDECVVGLRLGRNAGQHSALLAGVRASRFDVTVTIDDDLQNPPEEIPRLISKLADDVDVVYASPRTSAQVGWRRISGRVTRRILAFFLGATSMSHASSFRAFRTNLREGFPGDLGPSVSLDALLSWSTSRFDWIEVEHQKRLHGKSNYSLRKLLTFAFDTATGYSTRPLKLALVQGFLTAFFGVAILMFVVVRSLFLGSSVPGFAFLASIISLFSGAQLITIGIIGEYLSRMHFRIMRKPTYVIAEKVGD